VEAVLGSVTTVFIGAYYEWHSDGTTVRYYAAGGQRIAMRKNGALYFLLADHLGSTSVTTDAQGNPVAEMRYEPWGQVRYQSGSLPTRYTYTGQYSYMDDFGLMYYHARWYDPALGRFAQADTIVPGAGSPLAWDRYAYVNNNPLRYTDPSGHELVFCGAGNPSCQGAGKGGGGSHPALVRLLRTCWGWECNVKSNRGEDKIVRSSPPPLSPELPVYGEQCLIPAYAGTLCMGGNSGVFSAYYFVFDDAVLDTPFPFPYLTFATVDYHATYDIGFYSNATVLVIHEGYRVGQPPLDEPVIATSLIVDFQDGPRIAYSGERIQ